MPDRETRRAEYAPGLRHRATGARGRPLPPAHGSGGAGHAAARTPSERPSRWTGGARPSVAGGRLVLVLLALLIAACGAPAPAPEAQPAIVPSVTPAPRGRGDTLRLVYFDAPSILNPHLISGAKDLEVSRITYEPLASFDGESRLVPILAAEIPSRENGGLSADGTTVTWRLRRDVRWSDGAPFTADDVRFTFEYVRNPAVKATFAGSYDNVRGVEVVDPHTLRVTFTGPTPFWAVPFVGKPGMILPRHIFGPYSGPNAREAPANLQPVGTGPYRVVGTIRRQEVLFLGTELVPTNKIVFEPNPYYREPDKPHFRRVEVRGGGTTSQAYRVVLEDGDADYAYNIQIGPEEQRRLEARGEGRVRANPTANISFLVLNLADPRRGSEPDAPNPVLDDPLVRQAIAHAVDRERIAREVYGAAAVPEQHYVVAPEQYRSSRDVYPFDVERAAALLDQAGWLLPGDGVRVKDGRPLELSFQVPLGASDEAAQRIISDDLEALGFRIRIELKDPTAYYGTDTANPNSNVRFLDDLGWPGWVNDSPDPGPNLSYWTCAGIPREANGWSGYNLSRWCRDDFDRLLREARSELDPDRRAELMIALNDLMIADVPFVVVARLSQLSAVNNTLAGVELSPWDAETWRIQDWRRVATP